MTVFTRFLEIILVFVVLSHIKSTSPHPVSLGSILLLLSSHLRLGPPSCFFPSGYLTKILYAFLMFFMLTTYPASNLLDLMNLMIFEEEYKFRNFSLCSFLQFPVTCSLLGPHNLLGTQFSDTIMFFL